MKKGRVAFVCSLAGLFLAGVIVVLAMKAWTRPSDRVPPEPQPEASPISEEAPAAPAPADAAGISPSQEQVATDTEALLDEDPLLADVSEISDRDHYEKLDADVEAARKELRDQLYKTEVVTEDGRTRKDTALRVSREKAIETLEQFIDRFSCHPYAWPGMLTREQMTLAQLYYAQQSIDKARHMLGNATSQLDGPQRDDAIIRWARMEKASGDVAYAERLLIDLASSAIPEPDIHDYRGDMEEVRRLKVPLLLAWIYRDAGRMDDARKQIDEVKRFALSLEESHQAYRMVPGFYGRACREEINIIFDLAEEPDVESALEKAETIVTEYETALADYRSRGSEHTRTSVDNHAKNLRELAQSRADKLRAAAGAE